MLFTKKQRLDWAFALALGDVVMTLLSVVLTSVLFLAIHLESDRFFGPYPAWLGRGIVFASINFFLMRSAGLYTWHTLNRRLGRPFSMAWTSLYSGSILLALGLLLGTRAPGTLKWTVLQIVDASLLLWAGRIFMHFMLTRDMFNLPSMERIAFIGPSARVEKVIGGLRKEMKRFQKVIGYFQAPFSETVRPASVAYPCLGALQDLEPVLIEKEITLLVLDARTMRASEIHEIIALCARLSVGFRMVPNMADLLLPSLKLRMLAGIPLVGPGPVPLDAIFHRFQKRFIDILGALVGLALSAPIIAVLAVLIKAESPGSIFYTQTRLGLRGRVFRMIKLRSMKLNAESGTGPQWTTKNDPRRLKIGAFMRAWNLDEVPQFWNVLIGDMSLVGPRPERPELVERFTYDIRHYNLRHHCKPGMTSWAAINGWRGNTSLTHRLRYDLYYLENWSLFFDFQIMFRTLLPPKNAY